jgi:hypothetical protein
MSNMKKLKMLMLCLLASIMGAKAQIGYQISLLNTATGEPRANETVTVSVSLSNSENKVFYSETKSATTNDFGVISLSIGNADTFKDVDFTKMPFFIEVTANGVAIGKSQILSVPVAEVAKTVKPIDKSLIVGTWVAYYPGGDKKKYILEFKDDGTGQYTQYQYRDNTWVIAAYNSFSFTWLIDGSCVHLIYYSPYGDGTHYESRTLFFVNGMLLDGWVFTKQ